MFLHIAALKLILQQINMHFSLAILAATVAAANGAFKEGDECGVTAADFVNVDFSADYLVAGEEGCTIDGKTQCYCAPNLTDGESQGTFQWQCGGTVNFGPVEGKECPATVPVPKNSDILGLVPKQSGDRSCDSSINPTGRPGDEVCPYSECDEGGDTSAICACIDLAKYGFGEGEEWFCLHSTCSCGDELGATETSSAYADVLKALPLVAGAAVAMIN
jgi:hypothetical protein